MYRFIFYELHQAISELDLNDRLETTEEAEMPVAADDWQQRKILWWGLGINFGFFIVEMTTGWISRCMGLVAHSIVYGLRLFAVGVGISRKKKVATISGCRQVLFLHPMISSQMAG